MSANPSKARNHIVLMFTAFLCLGVVTSCTESPAGNSTGTPTLSGPPNTTYPMPPLKGASVSELGWVLPETDDGSLGRARIGDYEGRVLVLDFYATWCAPCRESVPLLVKLQGRYGERGLAVVGLNVGGADDRVKVAEFAKELQIQYALGFPDRPLTEFLLSKDATIPQTFVFKRDGTLAKHLVGFDKNAAVVLEQVIQTELGNQD